MHSEHQGEKWRDAASNGPRMSKRKLGHKNTRDIVSEGLCGPSRGTAEINPKSSVL